MMHKLNYAQVFHRSLLIDDWKWKQCRSHNQSSMFFFVVLINRAKSMIQPRPFDASLCEDLREMSKVKKKKSSKLYVVLSLGLVSTNYRQLLSCVHEAKRKNRTQTFSLPFDGRSPSITIIKVLARRQRQFHFHRNQFHGSLNCITRRWWSFAWFEPCHRWWWFDW